MKKQKKPTVSQYSYMVTGLLSACVQRTGMVTETDVKMAIETAKVAYQMISELVADQDDEKPTAGAKKGNTPPVDHFADYPWDDQTATYTQLANWLKDVKGITSNRRISNIFHECLENGFITRNPETRRYDHPLP